MAAKSLISHSVVERRLVRPKAASTSARFWRAFAFLFNRPAPWPRDDHPGVDPTLKYLDVLSREDIHLRTRALLDGVEPRPLFPFGGPGSSTLLSVLAIGFHFEY
jgi:hypothetical protein